MKNIIEYYYLLIVNILELRKSWFFQLLFGLVMPFGMVFILSTYIDTADSEAVANLFTGNIIVSVTMPILLLLTSRLSLLKTYGSMDYYKSLPINMNILIAALMTVYFLTYLPSIAILYFLFYFMLGLSFSFAVLAEITAVLLFLVCSLVGLAAFIGLKAKTVEQANIIGNIVFAVIITASPVLIPADKLPAVFTCISYISPSGYGMTLIKGILTGSYTFGFYAGAGVLALMTVLSFFMMSKVVRS